LSLEGNIESVLELEKEARQSLLIERGVQKEKGVWLELRMLPMLCRITEPY
jgi:hypothetical protein